MSRTTTRPRPTEAQVVKAITDALDMLGYRVLRVGQRNVRNAGSDPGVPDLLVTCDGWPAYRWCGIEVKASAGSAIRLEQKALAETNRIAICWTVAQALRAVESLEYRYDATTRLLSMLDQLEGQEPTP